MWTARQLAGRPGLSRWAPWVVVDARATFPFCSLTEQRDRVAYLETRGYQQIFSGDGYVVPHASGLFRRSTPPARRVADPLGGSASTPLMLGFSCPRTLSDCGAVHAPRNHSYSVTGEFDHERVAG